MQEQVHTYYYGGCLNANDRMLYNALADAVMADAPEGRLQLTDLPNLARVYRALLSDYPEALYWDNQNSRFSYIGSSPRVEYMFSLRYLLTPRERARRRQAIRARAADIVRDIQGLTPYQRVLRVHNAFTSRVSYGPSTKPPQYSTIEGPLLEGYGVCGGISRTLMYLLNRAGVHCMYAFGTAWGKKREPELHAWNIVQLNGHYYHLDATWNDNNDFYPSQAYMAISDAELQADHRLDTEFPMPRCDTSMCPLPQTWGLAGLVNALCSQMRLGWAVTEVRAFDIPADNSVLVEQLSRFCTSGSALL